MFLSPSPNHRCALKSLSWALFTHIHHSDTSVFKFINVALHLPPVKVVPEHHPAHERIFKYSKDISDFCAFQRRTFQMINWPASFCFSVLPKTARRIHKCPSLALWCGEDHLLKIQTCKTSPLRERTPPEGDDNRNFMQLDFGIH